MVAFSKSRSSRVTLHFFKVGKLEYILSNISQNSFLGVKRVEMKQIDTFEFLGVNLLKCDLVIGSLEYVDLLHHIQGALGVVPLLSDGDLRVVVSLGGLAVLRV